MTAASPSGRVFISYRRQETSGLAGRLYDRLAAHFGEDQVFMDVDTIALGVDFAEVITEAVSTCQVLLAVIGPTWLIATGQDGRRRLEDPDDIVRLEVAAALERSIRVIPVLVEGAMMPRRQELPEALAGLARRNALSLRHESFRADADRLLTAIEPILGRPASQAQISTGPARPTTPPVKATEPETARTAEITIPASVRPDTGWSTSQVRTFEHPSKWTLAGPKQVLDVVFSSDGRWLATASDDHTARIWDVATGQPLQTLSHNKEVRGVAFSPDGRWLATAGWDKTARIWDVAGGQPLRSFSHNGVVEAVVFSPDGRWLVTASFDNTARIWDVAGGQPLRSFSHNGEVVGVVFSPDGRWVATASRDKTARVWDVAGGQPLQTLSHNRKVVGVVFSRDGRWVATASGDKTARVWDVASGQPLRTFSHNNGLEAVAISPDGRWLATATMDKAARIWDVTGDQPLQTLSHNNGVEAVAFSPDGRWVATAGWGNRAVLWMLTPPSGH